MSRRLIRIAAAAGAALACSGCASLTLALFEPGPETAAVAEEPALTPAQQAEAAERLAVIREQILDDLTRE
jgi:hypothetical protein